LVGLEEATGAILGCKAVECGWLIILFL
jgi:hypothetical protein